MKYLKRLVVIFSLLIIHQNTNAQQPSGKTLLWRISGKDLQKPSYLYGTMHLSDKRLFYFGDSVYNSLESVQGFAMELDPDSMMDSVFSKLSDEDTTSLLVKILEKEKFDKVSSKLEKKFHMPANKITRKKLMEDRENWYYKDHKKDDMKSVVDMYLYNIAHQLGKWVGGIEDVNDQLIIKDELGKDIDIMDYINEESGKSKEDYLGKMINTYVDGDIDEIERMSSSRSVHYKDVLLITRNIKMARRMDSLAHIRNSFFAVGAAHLPGDSGVIQLLRGRGFTVDPVYSSKKIAPEKYVYTKQEFPWVKVAGTDSAYTVEMPGKTSDMKVLGDELKMKVYADLVSNIFYMTGFIYNTNSGNDEAYQRMIKGYTTGAFKKLDEKKINHSAFNGEEIISTSENIYYRIQLLQATDKIYLVIAGAQKKDDLFVNDVDRFFSGFVINDKILPKPAVEWTAVNNEQKGFSMLFPKKPAIDKLKQQQAGENMETSTYTCMDIAAVTYYMLVISETKKGYLITADSIIFNSKIEGYRQSDATISDTRYFDFQRSPALSFTAASKVDGTDLVSKVMVISRGNRSYSLVTVTEKGKEDYPEISRFFRSFNLLDYKQADWAKRSSANNLFSTWLPSSIETGDETKTVDTTRSMEDAIKNASDKNRSLEYLAFDPGTVLTYYVNAYPTGRYYWTKSIDSTLSEQLKQYYTDTSSYMAKLHPGKFDSLMYKKEVINGAKKGYEILVSSPGNHSFKKIRLFCQGDSIYHLLLIADKEQINNENNNKFFNDFRFANEQVNTNLFNNKTALIMADLQHKDSVTRAEANDAIEAAKFTVTDLPLLYDAYLKKYPVDSNEYRTTNERLGTAISKLKDSNTIDFIKNNYSKVLPAIPGLKMNMLELLAKQKTSSAYALIKKLLLTDPPTKGTAYGLFYDLADSLQLCKQFFPEISKLYADTVLGTTIIGLTARLIDSSLLSKEMLDNNIEDICSIAEKQLQDIKKDNDDFPFNNNYVIEALGKINTKRTNDLLYEFTKLPPLYIKEDAVVSLLKNGQVIPAAEIKKIAADQGLRIEFYSSLREMGKTSLFPKEYATQQKFAESYLYEYNEDGDEEGNTVFKPVKEKVIEENGVSKRYYLFKMTSTYEEDDAQTLLAICGPFDADKKVLEIKKGTDETTVLYDEKYSASTVDELFNKFIEQRKAGK